MSDLEEVLIHALAVHPDEPDQVRIRATIRLGDPVDGDCVWFEGTDRVVRELRIVKIKRSSRLCTITLGGTKTSLQDLVGGTYLRGAKSEN